MTSDDTHATLLQSQIRTLRVQVHALERRMFDIEMALELGAVRADVHGDEISAIKQQLSEVIKSLDGIVTP